MFKRKIYDQILNWKRESDGKAALMIEGARRVGKSTIIEEFVKNEYKSSIIISFEKADQTILDLFNNLQDLDSFFLYLQQYYGIKLYERNSAIVFDEVQLFPRARQSIKTFLEDGRYDYYETGSLISLKKNIKNILIPSEESNMKMYPMDFEEFLWATHNDMKMDMIKDAFLKRKPLPKSMHDNIMRLYRTYMLIGGMPQAISEFVKKNNFSSVETVKKEILNLYRKDSIKIDEEGSSSKASSIFYNVPSNLEKHDKSFSPSLLKKNSYVKDYRKSVSDLEESMMVNVCYRCTVPALDQKAHCDENKFKIYMGDTGILFTSSFVTPINQEKISNDFLKGNLDINEGMYFENMVAQSLRASGHDLYYSKFKHKDSKKYQEVDFIIVHDNKPCPVEVKSGKRSKLHKSLNRFVDKYADKIGEVFVIHAGEMELCENVTYLPIYMTSFL